MRRPAAVIAAGGTLAFGLAVWLLLVALPRWYGPHTNASAAPSRTAATTSGRKIKARLFYVSQDGSRLAGVERDVPYGDGPAAQAEEIIAAQISPVTEPLVSAVPAGTKLRAVYVTERGEAYVDLSREIVAAHTGGSLDELLTIYAIVDAVTANLPAITAVQILIDGKQVETLAGHVDLRRPLAKSLAWVE